MAHATKYAVIHDYSRTVDISKPRVKSLNGDTATFSSLAFRQVHKKLEVWKPAQLDYREFAHQEPRIAILMDKCLEAVLEIYT
jgi:hypothetical protein